MPPPVEEEHLDVLQNIEFVIIQIYHKHPELVDFDVDTVLNALLREYQAEISGRTQPPPAFNELRQELYDNVKAICEVRLGVRALETKSGEKVVQDAHPISLEVMVLCLKRLRKSIRLWTKHGGRQGYLKYVEQFIL